MASKKGLFRLPTRISRVFAVMVKHVVMLLSRIRVIVGCEGIFVVDHGCVTDIDIYPLCAWEFSFTLASVHLLHRRWHVHVCCRTWPHQMILLNEQLYWAIWEKGPGHHLRSLFIDSGLSYICHDTMISSHVLLDGLSRAQMHGVNGQSIHN
jgi:hypothetical protein